MTRDLWNDFNEELLNFISSKVGNKTQAEDILQEVFIKIHQRSSQISQIANLQSWVYTITRNTVIDYYRKHKPTQESDSLGHVSESLPEEEPAENAEMLKCLVPFIKTLPETDQKILMEVGYGKLSLKKYAQKADMEYSTVKSRAQRARKKLKEKFMTCCDIQSDRYGNIISVEKKDCNC